MRDPQMPVGPESPKPAHVGAIAIDRATRPGQFVIADGLPLARLYTRFDAIARGRAYGDSSAAHRSVIERLEANQQRAEAMGWTAFALERAGGSGRLELRGTAPTGLRGEIVPDAIPYDRPEPTTTSNASDDAPLVHEGRVGTALASVSWHSRMSWLDDGGR